jgi:hypothetical protein
MLLYGMWTAYDLAKLQQEYDAAIAARPLPEPSMDRGGLPAELASLVSPGLYADGPPPEPDYFAIALALASH